MLKKPGYSGFGGLNWEMYRNDFEFVIDTSSVSVPTFLAEFLSRKVSKAIRADAGVCKLEFAHAKSNTHQVFTKLIALVKNGERIDVEDGERAELWRILCDELESDLIYSCEVSGNDVPIEVLVRNLTGLDGKKVAALASDFPQIMAHGVAMDENMVGILLQSEGLMLEDEDSLLRFLLDNGFYQLLSHVRPNLSKETKEYFLGLDILEFRGAQELLRRMLFGESERKEHSYYTHMAQEVKPEVETSGLGCHGGSTDVNCVKEAKNNEFLWLSETFGAFVLYDYGQAMIKPEKYTIKLASDEAPCLRNWVLEGSLSGNFWTTLDEQRGNSDLSSNERTFSKDIDKSKSFPCKLIRLRQIGPSDKHSWAFHIAYLGITGAFLRKSSEKVCDSGSSDPVKWQE